MSESRSAQIEVSSEYMLPRSPDDLPPINDYSPFNSNLLQVPCQRNASGLNFGNGSQRYQFSVSPQQRCPLNEAYFRIRMSLYASVPTRQDAAHLYDAWGWSAPLKSFSNVIGYNLPAVQPYTIPLISTASVAVGNGMGPFAIPGASPSALDIPGHDIAFAENVCANLFTQMNVKINNIIFSQVQNYLPQIDMLVQRLTTSYISQKANRYANLVGMSLRERIDYVSSNSGIPSGCEYAGVAVNGFTVAGSATSAPTISPLLMGTDAILQYPSASSFTASNGVAAGVVPGFGQNPGSHVEFIWRPYACSAFNIDKYLMAGNYEVELLPAPYWYVQCLESIQHIPQNNIFICDQGRPPSQDPGQGLYGIGIDDIQFFVPLVASPEYLDDLSFYLSLSEYEIQGKPLAAGSATNTLVYTIPWSTQCVCNVLQTNLVGQTTLCPPSKFMNIQTNGQLDNFSVLDLNSNDLSNLQITYQKVYPQNNYTSQSSNIIGRQNVYQRYYDTFSNSKALWETGCQEPFIENSNPIVAFCPFVANGIATTATVSNAIPTYGFSNADFISRGAMYCVSVAKPQESKITQLTLVIQYQNDPNTRAAGVGIGTKGLSVGGNPQILLMSAYKKTVKVTIANSVCVGIEVAEG